VILGPTEHRVARWLADRTRSGRITLRMADVAAATRVERSEAYRITARLRILGLFGIQNDQGGTRGGRRFWRTAIAHDGAELDETRHREAWSRVVAWARARGARLRDRLTPHHHRLGRRPYAPTEPDGRRAIGHPPGSGSPAAGYDGPGRLGSPGPSFLEQLIAGGLSPALLADFTEPRRRGR